MSILSISLLLPSTMELNFANGLVTSAIVFGQNQDASPLCKYHIQIDDTVYSNDNIFLIPVAGPGRSV